jgi:hypothetical protein
MQSHFPTHLAHALTCLAAARAPANSPGEAASAPGVGVDAAPLCVGFPCTPAYSLTSIPSDWHWTVTLLSATAGQGHRSCEPCRPCQASVAWDAQFPPGTTWTVDWGTGSTSGSGQGSGRFSASNVCDGEGHVDTFTGGGEAPVGTLDCTCSY